MKLAIMQPYFFPYIGYFQLIKSVDTFVIYDDVNYIKGGWINRNKILINGHPSMVTLSVSSASSFKKINEINLSTDKKNRDKIIDSIYYAYKKTPYFSKVMPLVQNLIENSDPNLSQYIKKTLQIICEYLQIETNIIDSSKLEKNSKLKSADKVIDICNLLKANVYINAIGGKELYDKDVFKKNNITLNFLKTGNIIYKQLGDDFIPNLSIIDVLMFNSVDEVNEMLANFTLV